MEAQKNIDISKQAEGLQAIYREGTRFSLVQVNDIDTWDKGLSAIIKLIPTPGLVNDRPAQWKILLFRNTCSFTPDQWVDPYLSLSVSFGDDLVEAVLKISDRLPANYSHKSFGMIGSVISEYFRHRKKQESLAVC
jgi:hypothetical protein